MAELDRLIVAIEADTEQLRRELRRMQGDMGRAGNSVQSFSRRFERSMESATARSRAFARQLTSVQGGIAALGAGAGLRSLVNVTREYDDALVRMNALVGISRGQIELWRSQIREMAPEVRRGPRELADAMFFITSAGARGAQALDILEKSAKAATAGLGETSTVADAVTSAINAYGPAAMSAGEATAILVAGVREGKAEAASFAPVLGRVLPIASQLEVEFNEVVAALASMTKLGTSTDEASTQLVATFNSILNPSKGARDALEELGLTAQGLRDQLADQGLLSVLFTLQEAVGGNEAALASLFPNVRALTGVLNLAGKNADATREVFASLAATTEGDLNKAFAATADELGGRLDASFAKLEAAALRVGEQVVPTVADSLEFLADNIQGVTAAGGALIGMRLGSAFGPWGAAIGMVAGGLGTLTLNLDAAAAAERTFEDAVDAADKALRDANDTSIEAADLKRKEAAARLENALAIGRERTELAQSAVREQEGLLRDRFGGEDLGPDLMGDPFAQNRLRQGDRRLLKAMQGELRELRGEADEAQASFAALGEQVIYLNSATSENTSETEDNSGAQSDNGKAVAERFKAVKDGVDLLKDHKEELEKQRQAAKANIADIRFETSLIGQSNNARDLAIALREAEADATHLSGEELKAYLVEVEKEIEAQQARRDAQEETEKALEASTKAAERARKEIERIAERSVDAVVDFGADAIFGALKDENKDFWEEFKEFGLRAISQVAAEAAIRPIITTVIQPLIAGTAVAGGGAGSVGGASVGAAGGGSSSGSGGGFSLPPTGGIFNGGGFSGITASIDAFGTSLGFGAGSSQLSAIAATGQLGPGTLSASAGSLTSASLSSVLGGASAGFGAGMFVNSLLGGSQVGGAIGSGIGAVGGAVIGSVVPGVGTLLGGIIGGAAGGAFGGLFGGGKTSVGPNGSTEVNLGSDGRFVLGSTGVDNGANPQVTIDVARNAADSLNALIEQFDLSVDDKKLPIHLFIRQGSGTPFGSTSSGALADRVFASGALQGQADPINRAIRMSTHEDIVENLQTVTSLMELLEDIDLDPEEITQAERAIESINRQFEDLSTQAQRFGISTDELEEARERALEGLTEGFDDAIRLQIEGFTDPLSQALEALENAQEERLREAEALGADLVEVERLHAMQRAQVLETYFDQANRSLQGLLDEITGPALSNVSPAAQLTGLRGSFEAAAAQAFASPNDPEMRDRVAALGSQLVDLSRTTFASSGAFQSDRDRVREVVEALIATQPGNDVVAAVETQATEQVALLASLNDEVQRLTTLLSSQQQMIVDLQSQLIQLEQAA